MVGMDMTEHLNCVNYDNGENPLVEYIQLKKGGLLRKETLNNKVVLIIKGKVAYSYAIYAGIEVVSERVVLFPSGYDTELEAVEDSVLLAFRLGSTRQLCDRFQLEQLLDIECEIDYGMPHQLAFNEMLKSYVESLLAYFNDGVRCYYFHELKLKELLYIFRIYYSKEDMKRLFYPLLTNDLSFSDRVIHASSRARHISDLAEASGYSISGFSKRFRKVFNEPAYKWLQQRRAERIYKQINRSDLPLKAVISSEGFSTLSELNKFCKRYYGQTPSKIRKTSKFG